MNNYLHQSLDFMSKWRTKDYAVWDCIFPKKETRGNIDKGGMIKIMGQNDTKIDGSDHLNWHEYFMSVAQLAAKRSKDPSTKVGACIVNGQNKIVATGYNGMPNGVSDSSVPWTKEGKFLEKKYAYVVHAELNAILNSVLTDQTGCRLFVSLFPCNECAKAIIQSGIRHVIYLSDKHSDKDSTRAAKMMFKLADVKHEQFSGRLLIWDSNNSTKTDDQLEIVLRHDM